MTIEEVYSVIIAAAQAEGVRPSALLVTAQFESGFNPGVPSNTRGEYSVGLFQLNIAGGAGSGYSEAQLLDPYLNSEVAARHMAGLLGRYGSYEEAIAHWCGGRCSNADLRVATWPDWWGYDNGGEVVPTARGSGAGEAVLIGLVLWWLLG